MMSLLAWLLPSESMIGLTIQVSALVTAAVLVALVLEGMHGKCGAPVRHGIWLCALVSSLLGPLAVLTADHAGITLASVRFLSRTPELSGSRTEPSLPGEVQRQTSLTGAFPSPGHRAGQPPDQVATELGTTEAQQPGLNSAPVPAAIGWLSTLGRIALAIWATGALVLLSRFIHGLWLVEALRRSTRPSHHEPGLDAAFHQALASLGAQHLPALVVSPLVGSPVAAGLFRPLVILPEGLAARLSPSSLCDVLIHEYAHIIRRDPLVGLLQRAAEILYWPQPLVHLLNRRLARAREEICDNHVLRRGNPCDFARTLLTLAQGSPRAIRPMGALPLMNSRWNLEERVAGLLDPKRKPMTHMNSKHAAMVAVIIFGASLTLAAVRVEDTISTRIESSAPARTIRGLVIDAEWGQPVKGAIVRLVRDWESTGPVTTDADGTFAMKVMDSSFLEKRLIATTADGRLQGMGTYQEPSDSQDQPNRVGIRLEPCRTSSVTVTDDRGGPVAAAVVEVLAGDGPVCSAVTDDRGQTTLQVARGANIDQVIALKSGVGLDYFENYSSWPPVGTRELPARISLVLNGARPARLKSVDSHGHPVPGVTLYAWLVKKPGKLYGANICGRATKTHTDSDGVARFDWVPADLEGDMRVGLIPGAFHVASIIISPEDRAEEKQVRLVRKSTLRGKVVGPDGAPAAGILVRAGGVGKDISDEYDQAQARTNGDGTFSIAVAPDHSYMIGVIDRTWAARSLTNIVPRREGDDYDLPVLRLTKGTVIRGKLTAGADHKPAVGQWVALEEHGDPLPIDYKPFTWEARESLGRVLKTDDAGHYAFRVGPGEYTLHLLGNRTEKLKVIGEETLTRDATVDP